MKKVIIIVLLCCFPLIVFAKDKCNSDLYYAYIEYARNISYDIDYSKSEGKFTITFYNVIDGLYFDYGGTIFKPNNDDNIIISSIKEGTKVNISIYGNDGCDSFVRSIYISLPYYNKFYGTSLCKGYEELQLCASSFTEIKPSEELLEETKKTYDTQIIQRVDKEEEEEEKINYLQIFIDFFIKYISKALIVIVSSFITISIYENKIRKIEHGI